MRSAYASPVPNETVTVRKGLIEEANARIDALDRALVVANSRADSLAYSLWRCEATRPEPKTFFESFEFGVSVGAAIVMLVIWALDAQLE